MSSLGPEAMELDEADIPCGISACVEPLLPEPIPVLAVKDLGDEVKTSQSATFGKLLRLMSRIIEPEFSEVTDLFDKLNRLLES